MRCPHSKSDMTPCYMRDGDVSLCFKPLYPGHEPDRPTHCVGCERSRELLDIERRKMQRGPGC